VWGGGVPADWDVKNGRCLSNRAGFKGGNEKKILLEKFLTVR